MNNIFLRRRNQLSSKGEKELPYIQLDYIESTGTQSIDTGLPCNSKYRWEITLQPTSGATSNSWLMGAIEQVGSSSTYKRFHPSNSTATLAKWWAGGKDTTNTAIPDNGKFDIIIGNRGGTNVEVNINDNVQSIATPDITNLTFWLFQRNSNVASFQTFGNYRLYKFKAIDANDKVVMNLIPCIRKSDGMVCMYDLVSNSFLDNQGTGSFRPGTLTNLPEGYAQVDYLQSDGSQWIDTLVYGNENTYAEIDFQYYETSTTVGHGKLFGTRKSSQDEAFVAGTGNGKISTSEQFFSQVDSGTIKDPTSKPYASLNKTNLCLSADGMYIDGVLGRQFDKITPFTTAVTLWLFGYYNSNTDTPEGAVKGKYRCFDFILREGDICNRFYFPMLDDEMTPCMYDVINDVPYYNEGAGNFIFGKIVKIVGLPKGFQELEYIENTGTQYINTGVTPTQNFEMDTKLWTNSVGSWYPVQSRKSTNANINGITGSASGATIRIDYSGKTINSSYKRSTTGTNTRINMKAENGNLSVDFYDLDNDLMETKTGTYTYTAPNSPIYIFSNEAQQANTDNTRISYLQMWQNGALVRDMIPCLDNNGRPCMYDKADFGIYYNLGEGEFLYGIKEPTNNLIKETTLGFPSGSDTSIGVNATYPYSWYTNDIYLEKGKTYEIKLGYIRTPSTTDDGTARFRMLNEDGTWWGAPASANYETFFESIELSGKVGATTISYWFSFSKAIIKPKKNCYIRPLIILGTKAKTPPCAYFVDIKEV